MTNKTKGILSVLALLLVGGSGFGLWYNNRLNQSRMDAMKAPSRSAQLPSGNSSTGTQVLKQGNFVRLDPLHYASGNARIINENGKLFVELQDNFKTNPDGPDLHVWLVNNQKLGGAIGGVDTNKASFIDLGKLTKFNGRQRYSITRNDISLTNYAVVIWCQAFNVQFSNAVLR
jgi:hypothetical protein